MEKGSPLNRRLVAGVLVIVNGGGRGCSLASDSAKAVIGDVEDHVILGTKVEVKEAIRRKRSQIQDNKGDKSTNCGTIRKKIFVGGLPPDMTGEEFKSFFESFGKTTDATIIGDKVSRISRLFGFVTYESEESVRAVLRTSRYLFHGKEVEVKVAIPKASNMTEHPNVHSQGHHHPSARVNWYHHDSSFQPMYGVIVGPPYANPAPIYHYANGMVATSQAYAYGMAAPSPTYANGMAAPSPAHAVNGFHEYNGYARTPSNGNMVAPRPFMKIRISKPPGINGEASAACSSPASCVEDPSPASEDSNLDGRPSPAFEDSNLDGRPSPSGIND